MAFAVISAGGKQYRVEAGQTITIEKIKGATKGAKVDFDMLLKDEGGKTDVGTPMLKGKVSGTVVEEGRHATIRVVKYKAKSRYLKQNGHRQPFVKVKIDTI